jgi:sulfite reductase alpha subunit-like flavoprotein
VSFAQLGYHARFRLTDYRDRIELEKAEFIDAFFNSKSNVYICGSPQLSDGVKRAFVSIWAEHEGKTEEEAREWMRNDGKDRFATDVFL